MTDARPVIGWSQREMNILRMRYGIATMDELARECGHSESSIRIMATRLKLDRGQTGRYQGRTCWTIERDEQVCAMRARGCSFVEIARAVKMSVYSVRNRCIYLGVHAERDETCEAPAPCPDELARCEARPGTVEKIDMMRRRAEARADTCQPGDGLAP